MALSLVSETIDTDFRAQGLERERMAPLGLNGDALHASPARAVPPRSAAPAFPAAEVIALLTAIGAVIGVRFALLIAIAGALGLAVLAMTAPNQASVWVQVAFYALVVIPVIWLEARKH